MIAHRAAWARGPLRTVKHCTRPAGAVYNIPMNSRKSGVGVEFLLKCRQYWNLKSIQQANIEGAIRHMDEARKQNDQASFEEEKDSLRITLEAIKNADIATYDKYVHLLSQNW